jgi:hypothetical protein
VALDRRELRIESVVGALSAVVIAGGLARTVAQAAAAHIPVGDVSLSICQRWAPKARCTSSPWGWAARNSRQACPDAGARGRCPRP